ncbi:hypothetical protein LY76DRAFT_253100 [Colletotrichum caudatum]|nr:hypothetical protein LY76DRAFT_253100 [Colletotrichum caudatum]
MGYPYYILRTMYMTGSTMYVVSTHVQEGDFRCPTALPSAGGRPVDDCFNTSPVGWLAGWHDRVSPLMYGHHQRQERKQNKRDRSVGQARDEREGEKGVCSDALFVSGVPQLSNLSLKKTVANLPSTDRPTSFHSPTPVPSSPVLHSATFH